MIAEDFKIDVSTLTRWFNISMPVTVLDVRAKSDREEWSIPGSIHADIYDKLKADDEHALDNVNLDERKPIVTVCAAGKMSLKAAELLRRKGFDAYSLEGGMKAWNFAWNTAEISAPRCKNHPGKTFIKRLSLLYNRFRRRGHRH